VSRDCHYISRNRLLFCVACAIGVSGAAGGRAQDVAPGGPPTRARVVSVENLSATDAFVPRPEIVQDMVRRGIIAFTGKTNEAAAWQSIVSSKEVVGIKVYSEPGANSGTRPAVVEAVVEGLLKAGVPASHIIIWDKRLVDLRLAGFGDLADRCKVVLAATSSAGYDDKVFYDNPVRGTLVAGDLEFDRDGTKTGRKSYVGKLLTQKITKIISIAPLLNHNVAGVCGHLYSVSMGSIDNTTRFEAAPEELARAVPETYALAPLSDHVALCITDALIGQYQGEQLSLLHYSVELNQIWFSKDPVALDVLAVQELERERQARNIPSLGDNATLFQNAGLLELGVPDPAKIRIDPVH
jgi:hypothetical protein